MRSGWVVRLSEEKPDVDRDVVLAVPMEPTGTASDPLLMIHVAERVVTHGNTA
jgi:hypothetical protein